MTSAAGTSPDTSPLVVRTVPLEDPGSLLALLPLEGALAVEVGERLGRLGHAHEEPAAALAAWASERNLEMRLTERGIDARVLEVLRRESP